VTDFELSYAVMALLYLGECCLLVPEGTVLFSRIFSRWRLNRMPGIAFTGGKRLVLLHPLPWAGEWHCAPSPDATLTERGILTVNSLCEHPRGYSPPRLLEYASPEGKARLEEFSRAGCPLDAAAGNVSGGDGGGAAGPPPAMEAAFTLWTDSGPVRESLERLRGLPLLKILCSLQFFWVFAGAPLLLHFFSLDRALPAYLFALFWLGGLIAVHFAAICVRVRGRSWKTVGKALWLFAYPPTAMRAVQILCAGALPPRHESAVAGALMRRRSPGERGGGAARRGDGAAGPDEEGTEGRGDRDAGSAYLADIAAKLRHRLFSLSLNEENASALARANESLLRAALADWGVPDVPTPHAPGNMDKDVVCHCPVCGVGLTRSGEYCPHCAEVRLLAK
jgi:hypothetical protein